MRKGSAKILIRNLRKMSEQKEQDKALDLSVVRQSALQWWNSMTFEEQFFATIKWLSSQNIDTTERHPHHLTGREIQEIHELHSA